MGCLTGSEFPSCRAKHPRRSMEFAELSLRPLRDGLRGPAQQQVIRLIAARAVGSGCLYPGEGSLPSREPSARRPLRQSERDGECNARSRSPGPMPAPVLLGLAANRSRVYNPLAYGERISLLALKAPGDHRGSITPNGMTGSKDGLRGPSADAASVKSAPQNNTDTGFGTPERNFKC